MTYIKPPASHECTWRSGPPPEVGWWPASALLYKDPQWLRFWDGKRTAAADHYVFSSPEYMDRIKWTDRWWLK